MGHSDVQGHARKTTSESHLSRQKQKLSSASQSRSSTLGRSNIVGNKISDTPAHTYGEAAPKGEAFRTTSPPLESRLARSSRSFVTPPPSTTMLRFMEKAMFHSSASLAEEAALGSSLTTVRAAITTLAAQLQAQQAAAARWGTFQGPLDLRLTTTPTPLLALPTTCQSSSDAMPERRCHHRAPTPS
jgi:hypothetical protein